MYEDNGREESKKIQEKRIQRKYAKQMDYKKTFGSEHGKRVLRDLLHSFHAFDTTFAVRATSVGTVQADPHMTIFNEGARSVVMGIVGVVYKNPIDVMSEIKKIEEDIFEGTRL